jgi:hypothetical protein
VGHLGGFLTRFPTVSHAYLTKQAVSEQITADLPAPTMPLSSWVRRFSLVVSTGAAIAASGCGGGSPSSPSPTTTTALTTTVVTSSTTTTTVPVIKPSAWINVAADVGWCGLRGAELTGQLLDSLSGPILLPGDAAYPNGSELDFANCFNPFWGRHKGRTYPVPGNHEYYTAGAAPFFAYFGANAGPPGLGYYSMEIGSWLVIAMNSTLPIGDGSAQLAWLRSTLAANPVKCTLAFWHHPRFSSAQNGDNSMMSAAFRALYEANADLIIAGHDHVYERMAPTDPDGRPDMNRGVRQFTVGTGGAALYNFTSMKMASEVRASVWGVLRLQLKEDGYDFEFHPVQGESFRDAGSGQCH